MNWFEASVRWYAVLALATWGLAPLVRWLCPWLPDRGAAIARPLALLGVVYPLWLLASIKVLPYSTVGLWVTLVVAAVVGWGVTIRRREVTGEWLRALLVAEVVFLVAFAGYIALRGFTPRITGTEKPMDMAFLAASARTDSVPPADPWFAGQSINYYYLGYFLHGSLARMAGVPAWIAFNLALATTFAMTLTAAAGLAFDAVRSSLGRRAALGAAALAGFLSPIAGNMLAPAQLLQHPRATIDASWWQGIGWNASRIVVDPGYPQPDTINEFPSFSFILGDLHPHVTALPFTLVALALALNLLRNGGLAERRTWAIVAISGAAIGALYPMNSWDFPTYLLIAGLAVLVGWAWSRAAVERLAVLCVASVVAWLPFFVTFVPFAGGSAADVPSALRNVPGLSQLLTLIGFYSGERTSVSEFLTVFGLPWMALVVFLGVELMGLIGAEQETRIPGVAMASVVVVGLVAIALPAPVVILAGAPLAVALWLLWRRRGQAPDARMVATALFAGGCGLILITEFFYLQDVFHGRFNTLFKVYYQVWTLFAIAAAIAVVLLWREAASRVGLKTVLTAAVTVAVIAGLVYPILSAVRWTDWAGPREWKGFDGAEFIGNIAPDDLAAIHWLTDHAKQDDVILEAPGCQYRINFGLPTSRISAFTGVPTVIGWNGSEGQWRGGQADLQAQIAPRAQDVAAIYADPQSPLVKQYDVTLLYVGHYERQGAPGECDIAGPFAAVNNPGYPGSGWTQVFASGDARIYRRAGT
jgi:YYY domain-containing protein